MQAGEPRAGMIAPLEYLDQVTVVERVSRGDRRGKLRDLGELVEQPGSVAGFPGDGASETQVVGRRLGPSTLAQHLRQGPGVDGVFFGPADLSASMGLLGKLTDPAVQAAIAQGIAKRAIDGTAASRDAHELGRVARPFGEQAWVLARSLGA